MSSSSTEPEAAAASDGRQRRRFRSLLVGSGIAIVLAVLLFVVLKPAARSSTGQSVVVGVGSVAPNFTLPSLFSSTGTSMAPVTLDALGKDRHRPVVLNFYASWCIPCEKETPIFGAASRALAAKGSPVQFVGVDVADKPLSKALSFTQHSGVSYPVGTDSTFRVSGASYSLVGLPDTFFINEEGVVIGRHLGSLNASQLNSWLHKLAGASA